MPKSVRDIGQGVAQVVDNSFETLLADAAVTATASQLISGFLRQVPTLARAITTDTAANIDLALPGAPVGSSFQTVVFNNSGGANAITFVAGAGVTLKPSTSVSVAQNKAAILAFVKTAAGAWDCYQVLGA